MARRQKVLLLPEAVRDELDARLKGCAFGNVRGLSDWLKEQGFDISPSAVHRYAVDLEAEAEAMGREAELSTRIAKLLVANTSDAGGALMEASERLAGDGLLRLMMALRKMEREGEIDPTEMAKMMPNITRALADLNRSGIARAKWQAEVAERLKAELEQMAKEGGDAATLDAVQQRIAIYLPSNGR